MVALRGTSKVEKISKRERNNDGATLLQVRKIVRLRTWKEQPRTVKKKRIRIIYGIRISKLGLVFVDWIWIWIFGE